jgi:hypothetical protein
MSSLRSGVEHPVQPDEVLVEQPAFAQQEQAALGKGIVRPDLVDQELLDRFLVERLFRVAGLDLFPGPLQVGLAAGQLVLVNGLLADPLPVDALQPDPLVAVNRIDVNRAIVGHPGTRVGVVVHRAVRRVG